MKALKRIATAVILAVLCLSMVSCGNDIKAGKHRDITIQSGKETELVFTAFKAGDYVVTGEFEGDVTCTAFAQRDGVRVQLSPESRESCFSFSFSAGRKEEVYLLFRNHGNGKATGNAVISNYGRDTVCDINYGHPVILDSGGSEVTDNSGDIFVSFTAPEAGIYSLIMPAGSKCAFKSDSTGVYEADISKVDGYPEEEFGADIDSSAVPVTLSKGECLYALVSVAGAGEISVEEYSVSPDPASAVEFVRSLYDSYGHRWEGYTRKNISPYNISMTLTKVTDFYNSGSYSSETCGNGKKVSVYLTESEYRKTEGWYCVLYSMSDLMNRAEGIYGSGRVAYSAGDGYLIGNKGYWICAQGWGDDFTDIRFKSGTAEVSEGYTVVTALLCKEDSSSYPDIKTTDFEKKFILFSTTDGVRLWEHPDMEADFPGIGDNDVAFLPDVLPDKFERESIVTVSASSGLRMRTGPGTDYDIIRTLPNGTQLRCYGQQYGWYYVKFAGIYGWLSADYAN